VEALEKWDIQTTTSLIVVVGIIIAIILLIAIIYDIIRYMRNK
jgi:hypothetical protein